MATTLHLHLPRQENFLGHVGDTASISCAQKRSSGSPDHSYTGLQVKLRLITEHEARASHFAPCSPGASARTLRAVRLQRVQLLLQ